MQTHRRLMFLGGFLLVLTFLLNDHHVLGQPNIAYVTGTVMIGVFMYSFYLFYSKGRGRYNDTR